MIRIHPRLGAAAAVICLGVSAHSQTNQVPILTGQLQTGSETVMRGYVVALESQGFHHDTARADVESDGSFKFLDVPYGDYRLAVENYYRERLYETYVTVGSRSPGMVIRMPKRDEPRPPSGGVSAARLQHPPSKKAFEAAAEAGKLAQSGRYAEAARKLERAIAISPDYADAHSNLAVQYIRVGRFPDAEAEIARAMAIGKPTALDLSNLAYAQSVMGKFGEATESARTAVRIDPNNLTAQFILGSLLARDRRTLPEAIAHLELAADTIPSARINLERARAALAKSTSSP